MSEEKPLNALYWIISYLICGIITTGIGIFYGIFIFKDIRSLTPKLPGYKSSQIFFIIAACFRGIGWIAHSLIFKFMDDQKKLQIVSTVTNGLPGYALTISYVLFFYLWSSICVNLIANDSTTGFKKKFKKIVNLTIGIIAVFGIVLIIWIIAQIFLTKDKYFDAHPIELFLAIIRDFIVCIIILVETAKIIVMSEKPFCSLKYNESIYCWMLIYIVIALYIRAFSIILFSLISQQESAGCLIDYLNTFITAVISEIVPCFMILFNRRRSGLLSVYDLIE